MYSSDEYENEHAGTSASGSSAFGIGALDHIVKKQIKKLDKNYDSEGDSIKEIDSIMEEYDKICIKEIRPNLKCKMMWWSHIVEQHLLLESIQKKQYLPYLKLEKLGRKPSSVEI